jgi:hypothetical protein
LTPVSIFDLHCIASSCISTSFLRPSRSMQMQLRAPKRAPHPSCICRKLARGAKGDAADPCMISCADAPQQEVRHRRANLKVSARGWCRCLSALLPCALCPCRGRCALSLAYRRRRGAPQQGAEEEERSVGERDGTERRRHTSLPCPSSSCVVSRSRLALSCASSWRPVHAVSSDSAQTQLSAPHCSPAQRQRERRRIATQHSTTT